MNEPLYLTRLQLGFDLAASLRVRNSYDWHQRVWQCFPDRNEGKRDFLTRLDEKDDHYQLLILGPVRPQCPDWCPSDAFGTKEVADSYFAHRRYSFQLRANPTKKVTPKGEDGLRHGHGKRLPLIHPDELRAWLERKATGLPLTDGTFKYPGGFRIRTATITPLGNQFFKKRDAFGPHFCVDFRGELEVTHAASFRQTFRRGIGSAKAFGFGMLVIAPAA